MRRLLPSTILATALLVVFGALADDVVLRDGRIFRTVGPPVLKGRMVILKMADGQLLSIPAEEIDMEKTAAARAAPAPAPAPTATPNRPLTPAEAAVRTTAYALKRPTPQAIATAAPAMADITYAHLTHPDPTHPDPSDRPQAARALQVLDEVLGDAVLDLGLVRGAPGTKTGHAHRGLKVRYDLGRRSGQCVAGR